MKKIIFIVALATLPLYTFAMPAFPMAFWGNVNIDGSPAPSGTIIRAYYLPNTLAGEVTTSESGVYGYNSSAGQKLLVSEGSGIITFKFISGSNPETTGSDLQTGDIFVSGQVVNKDLNFKTSTSTVSRGGSGGGGAGGGNSLTLNSNNIKPTITGNLITITNALINSGNLTSGLVGPNVMNLQAYLNSQGFPIASSGPGSPGNETTFFGALTRSALARFQAAHGISPALGYFGPLTRAYIQAHQ